MSASSSSVESYDPHIVSRAIVTWTGRGRNSWPVEDDVAVLDAFGAAAGEPLLARIKELKGIADLAEMANTAAAEFRTRHPELDDEAVEALAWSYSFDFK